MSQQAAARPAPDGEPPAVTLDMAIEAVRETLPLRRRRKATLTAETRLDEDLGLTSLDVGEIYVRLQERIGQPLDTADIEETRTIGDLLRAHVVSYRR